MILRPRNPIAHSVSDFVAAWDAVLRTQKQPATEWQLIEQADHAALAGEMASKATFPEFPKLDPEVIQAISVHDDGWKQIDEAARERASRRPLSFLEEPPADILKAWQGSITVATQIAPITGILVSEHFCRIARDFAQSEVTPPEVAQVLTTFIEREIAQREELQQQQRRDAKEIDLLVDVLQFFDLLSLYVCCGSAEDVKFPQKFNQKIFQLRRQSESKYRLDLSLFNRPTSFSIEATSYRSRSREQLEITLT